MKNKIGKIFRIKKTKRFFRFHLFKFASEKNFFLINRYLIKTNFII